MKVRRRGKRVLALMLAVLMVVCAIPVANWASNKVKAADKTYVLDATADLTAAAAGTLTDGGTIEAGTDKYFTIYTSTKMKIDGSTKAFDDGYEATQRINVGGASDVTVPKGAVGFETKGTASVKIWWVSGGDGRSMAITDTAGTVLTSTTASESVKNSLYISTLNIENPGKYFVAVPEGSNYIFKIEVTEAAASAAPTVSEYVLDATADLTAAAAGTLTDGGTIVAGTSDFFTVYTSTKMKIDGSTKAFDDGYEATQRINVGGASDVTVPKGAVGFETKGTASVKIWWVSGGDGRSMAITDTAGTVLTSTTASESVKNSLYISTLNIENPGKYFVAVPEGSNYIFKIQVTDTVAAAPVVNDYILDATADLTAAAAGTLTDGGTIVAGTSDFFTVYTSTKMKIDGSTKAFDDGYEATQRINVGGASDVTVPKGAVGFETKGTASVKIWWVSGGDGRSMAITDTAGTVLTSTTASESVKNSLYISTLSIENPGKYFVAVPEGSNYIFKIQVTDTVGGGAVVEEPTTPWNEVAAPVLGNPTLKTDAPGTIVVPYTMVIDDKKGAESLEITVKNAKGEVLTTLKSLVPGTAGTKEFTPSESGTYTFSVVAKRSGEEDKAGNTVMFVGFSYPLTESTIGMLYNKGNGSVELGWSAVKEATSYVVEYSADGKTWTSKNAGAMTSAVISGLTIDKEYTFRVVAKRGSDATTSDEAKVKITAEAQTPWGYIVYGNGKSESNAKLTGDMNVDGKITLESGKRTYNESTGTWEYSNNNGKWVPASYDGLQFYYTTVPSSLNFTLRAKVTVDQWILTNGQEAFGVMATDQLGGSGWNNSYSAYISKNEYYWDGTAVTTDSSAQKVSQKLGIGAQEKIGVTADNLAKIEANDTATIQSDFKASTYPLEQRYPDKTNVIGNGTNVTDGTISEMYLTVQKNNTGYFVTYESVDGKYKMTKKYYDPKALEQIDADNVYVGMFVARNGKVTFSDVTFTTIAPEDDAPAEERPVEKIAVNAVVQSSTASGNASYEFIFNVNCDGALTVKDSTGKVIAENVAVKADVPVKPATVDLKLGKNDYVLTFTPDANYVPGEFKVMESYEPKEIKHSVTYKAYGEAGQSLWVAPNATGNGTKANPMSIYDAVKYVQAGQTIVLKEGTYALTSTVKVERGVNGTADKKIYMVVDPDAKTRPVLDFKSTGAGVLLAGNYWVVKGFDVTGSTGKGIQVSGKNNVVDSCNTYKNGNTGLQISRYLTTDLWDNWPSDNLILNCESYDNADAGYEDADGFAAKLTIADGNVFDGCIAHHNADDGWDLFAKVQTGAIGSVTIKNSVAYANGWLSDGTNAGNGNGFKMGGDSMSGKHVLQNSVAYDNKAKGIDSNSCPDIIVKDCITYNNGSYNVAFYTNTAANTDFDATGIISFRFSKAKAVDAAAALTVSEQFKLKGTQDNNKVYKDTNYYWDGTTQTSTNKSGAAVSADWFVNLDTSTKLTRNADGSINMNGLLELTDKVPADVANAGMGGTASEAVVIPPSISNSDVQTGDSTPVAMYLVLVLASAVALGAAFVYGKKNFAK